MEYDGVGLEYIHARCGERRAVCGERAGAESQSGQSHRNAGLGEAVA
jgi:hypothetical protein